MECSVLFTDEFERWWNDLSIEELRKPLRPHARVAHQHQGRPYRVLYAFDPQRNAVLLIGGDKTGKRTVV
jgi:hypothetical protein